MINQPEDLLTAQILQTQRAALVDELKHSQEQLSVAPMAKLHSFIIPFMSPTAVDAAVDKHKNNVLSLTTKIEKIDSRLDDILDGRGDKR